MRLQPIDHIKNIIQSGQGDAELSQCYGASRILSQRSRYLDLLCRAQKELSSAPCMVFSVPGRTELGGNHTDHNNGRVLAAAVHLDCIAVVAPCADGKVRIYSDGMGDPIFVNLADVSPQEMEVGKAAALVRGVAAALAEQGKQIGGFTAWVNSTIPMGGGLSSSAAFSVLIGNIFSELYNEGSIEAFCLASAAHSAENVHFGKPCGFMDQLACAFRGILEIDFKDAKNPVIAPVAYSLQQNPYQLVVVNTGGDHADLTPEYAAVAQEMKMAAKLLEQDVARGLKLDLVMESISWLREKVGDRAVLRILHFLAENDRVQGQAAALRHGDFDRYLELVAASGDSSWKLLQNCSCSNNPAEQPLPLALVMTELLLQGKGAWRVHGGGFAGTIQVYVPKEVLHEYTEAMQEVFGANSVVPLMLRQAGSAVRFCEEG